jgi:hypothetical protein
LLLLIVENLEVLSWGGLRYCKVIPHFVKIVSTESYVERRKRRHTQNDDSHKLTFLIGIEGSQKWKIMYSCSLIHLEINERNRHYFLQPRNRIVVVLPKAIIKMIGMVGFSISNLAEPLAHQMVSSTNSHVH